MALLSAKQLADELGFTVPFVRRLALAGRIPGERYGSEWRFDLDRVRAAAQYTNPVKQRIHEHAKKAATRAFWRVTPKPRAV